MIGAVGYARHLEEVRQLNEQILAASKATVITSLPPKKSIIDHIIDKKVLPAVDIPRKDISSVIEIIPKTSTGACTTAATTVTVLKNGTVESSSPNVNKLLVERYDNSFFGAEMQMRLAGLIYPGENGHKASADFGLQFSYWRIWRFYPDLTIASHSADVGLSYHQKIGIFTNTYIGVGYGYRWDIDTLGPYASASLRF